MRRASRRTTTIAVLTLAAAAQATVLLVGRDSRHPTTPASPAPGRTGAAARPGVTVLRARRTGTLPAPLQDPATFGLDSGRALLLGGLDRADTSVAQVVRAGAGSATVLGSLPAAVHDAAATRIGGAGYLFGGGNVGSSDAIVRVSATGAVSVAGHLPVAASDVGAATVGASAYVVGGYDGTSPLRSIVAWAPGEPARVVGQLPRPLRYAAVASAGGRVIVAGGTDGGQASRAILAFDPATRRVRRIGTLPRALTHAAAATLGRTVYVIGGRGSGLGSQTGGIVAIDPATGRTRAAGRLPVATSDAGVAALGDRILVAGGRDRSGRVLSSVIALEPIQARAAVDVYAADRPGHLSPVVAGFPQRVYVPNSGSDTVDVIDPAHVPHRRALPHRRAATARHALLRPQDAVGRQRPGQQPHPDRPADRHPGRPVPVADPYNLYFTTDGRHAIVVAERLHRLDFRDPHTMRLQRSVPVPCAGRRPHGLHRRRPLRAGQLRVLRRDGEDRHRARAAVAGTLMLRPEPCLRTSSSRRTDASSTWPT